MGYAIGSIPVFSLCHNDQIGQQLGVLPRSPAVAHFAPVKKAVEGLPGAL